MKITRKRIKPEPLAPTDAQEAAIANSDAVLSALTAMATAHPAQKKKPVLPDFKYRSRFFFRVNPSPAQLLASKKKRFVKPELVHADEQVQQRLDLLNAELPPHLSNNISSIREFFLKEIAPLTLASTAGTSQAREVVQRMLGAETDSTTYQQFDRMIRKASELRIARFVATYMGLSKADIPSLLTQPQKPPEVLVIGSHHDRPTNGGTVPRSIRKSPLPKRRDS